MPFESTFILLSCLFGFLMAWGIGANDVSNAMGTSIGSKAMTIKQAIIIAAIFEFLGAFFAGGEVTATIRNQIIDTSLFGQNDSPIFMVGMLSALLAAASWLLVASFLGWPVSTTHTIVGAIMGFGLIELGIDAIQWQQVFSIIMGWLLSPILGAVIAYGLFISAQIFIFRQPSPLLAAKKVVPYYILLTSWIIYMITLSKLNNLGVTIKLPFIIFLATLLGILTALLGKKLINKLTLDPKADRKFHYTNVEKIFAILMVFTACAMAFAHGSNDVANAIGPLAAIVSATTNAPDHAPTPIWILFLGASGIVVGLAMYGHKVIATVGNNITQLTPSRGFSATLAAATTVVLASATGLPISTTHTLVGGILGVGLARGIQALNLRVIKNIFMSWFITFPIGAILAIAYFKILSKTLTLS